RPILAEVQALVSKTSFQVPRRTSDGFDYNRAVLLIAVAEKKANLKLSAFDAYINVIGGLRLEEPAADLSVALALISSLKDKVLPDDLVAIGELGLAGEVRAVGGIEQRVRECARLGFHRIVVPKKNADMKNLFIDGVDIFPVNSIFETLSFFA
ncbi:MAG: DNA repair protein RadA, partial [Clostridia bacterium]|nr:DNA repair protein RadA [Clostridia bacterium]